MRLSKRISVLLFSPLALTVLGATWMHTAQNKEHVDGYVYRINGTTPIPNVTVRVFYADGSSRDQNTDVNGYYKVEFDKQDKPITVKYLPLKERIFFSKLTGLSGSRPHTISRTEEVGYSASRAATLYDSAKEARAEMDSMPAAERSATEQYYRGLLTDVRIEQNTVTDENTRLFLQLKQNEARRQYGLALEPLKTETGSQMPAVFRKPFVGSDVISNFPEIRVDETFLSGMLLSAPESTTVETFRTLLKRYCSPTPLPGTKQRETQIYRCIEPKTQAPSANPGNPIPPNMNHAPGNANQSNPKPK